MSKVLELKNVTKIMGKRRIVDNVSFEIRHNQRNNKPVFSPIYHDMSSSKPLHSGTMKGF